MAPALSASAWQVLRSTCWIVNYRRGVLRAVVGHSRDVCPRAFRTFSLLSGRSPAKTVIVEDNLTLRSPIRKAAEDERACCPFCNTVNIVG